MFIMHSFNLILALRLICILPRLEWNLKAFFVASVFICW